MIKNRISSLIQWGLGTWTGALVFSIILGTLIILPIYGFRHGDHGDEVHLNLAPDSAYYHMNADGLSEQWHLLQPQVYGVLPWKVGDFARYTFYDSRNDDRREVQWGIVGTLEKDHAVSKVFEIKPEGRFWMEISGFRDFRNIHSDMIQLVSQDDLRVVDSDICFMIQTDYFPIHNSIYEAYPLPPFAKMLDLGKETLETTAGTFVCTKYQVEIGTASFQVWIDPQVSPIGIVKAQSDVQSLELTAFGRGAEIPVPEVIVPVLDGRSTLEKGCASCHKSYHECHIPVWPPK